MKNIKIIILIFFLTGNVILFAQHCPPSSPLHKDVVKEYKNLRLLRILDLREEKSEKVLPILNAMDKNREELFKKQHDLINKLERRLDRKAGEDELENLNEQYIDLFREHVQQREAHMEKLKIHLSPTQFSRYLVFQRQFGEKLRKRLEKIREQRKR
ncbi:MAG: hypothetical protein KGY75_09925 [Candidatus Cloacimonetes bacterium]|nr:hypothetical protein [Candidatus Cloacimonadota bacterium]